MLFVALQLILGGSGTGKTTYCYDQMIKDSMKENHNPIVFMLPEQANMVAEQDMVKRHPNGGTMEISVLSFTRLAFKVFDELNVHTGDILDDYGKSILIMKLMKEHQDAFCYYNQMIGKHGFVEEVKSILSEFYQYQITEDLLAHVIENLDPEKSLYYKMKDLQILYRAFQEEMRDSYIVSEQILSLLKEVIHESKEFAKADFYFDGYAGFTPVQYDVIGELLKLGGNVYITVTMDGKLFGKNDYKEHELFYSCKQMVDKLCKLTGDVGQKVLPHVLLEENYRLQQNFELAFLEKQVFRFPGLSYETIPESVHIMKARDNKEEALHVARMIKQYVTKEGYSYNDFAIVTGDLTSQTMIWKQCMEQLQIPYFLDFSEVLTNNPIVDIVSMIMELFISDFSYEGVFSLLKSGFFDISMNRIYDLENYVLKYGIRGKNIWERGFRGGVKGLHELNETRQMFMKEIDMLLPVFSLKNATAKDYIYAIYNFMSTNRMAEKLYEKSKWLEQRELFREAKSYSRVYDKFILILDKTMDLVGDEVFSREDFLDVLTKGMSDVRLGIIPSTLDQVLIGDLERSNIGEVKFLFVTGANEGLIPKQNKGVGILVDKDRKQLNQLQFHLAPDSKEDMYQQQFYFYQKITKPTEGLYISYRMADEKGVELHPSYFVKRVMRIFPKLAIKQIEDCIDNEIPFTEEELISEFTKDLVCGAKKDSSVYHVLKELQPEVLRQIIEGYLYHNQENIIDYNLAKKLYGERMVNSVSKLESYSACAYQYFLRYGLKLYKREEYVVENNHVGTILHEVMQRFFEGERDGKYSIPDLSDSEISQLVEALTIDAAKKINDTIFDSSYRMKHQLDVLVRVAQRSVCNLLRHLEQGSMQPTYFEKRFSPENQLDYITMDLEDGVRMELTGVVDRVDLKETEDAIYVKVIDYKSGAKDLDYAKIYEGKQLQLTVYMSVMLELLQKQYPDKKIIPTGMYYFRMEDPLIKGDAGTDYEAERVKKSRLTGFVNREDECLTMMDDKTGEVVSVQYTKKGALIANKSLVTTQELEQISDFVRDKMIEIGQHMIHGNIPMNPEKGDYNCPCKYCDYRSVCRFEAGVGGNAYRVESKYAKEHAKALVLGQNDSDVTEGQKGEEA